MWMHVNLAVNSEEKRTSPKRDLKYYTASLLLSVGLSSFNFMFI